MYKNLSLIIASFALIGISIDSFASHQVRGYFRSNGTYVESHRSMDPGESKSTGLSYRNDELVDRDDSEDE